MGAASPRNCCCQRLLPPFLARLHRPLRSYGWRLRQSSMTCTKSIICSTRCPLLLLAACSAHRRASFPSLSRRSYEGSGFPNYCAQPPPLWRHPRCRLLTLQRLDDPCISATALHTQHLKMRCRRFRPKPQAPPGSSPGPESWVNAPICSFRAWIMCGVIRSP